MGPNSDILPRNTETVISCAKELRGHLKPFLLDHGFKASGSSFSRALNGITQTVTLYRSNFANWCNLVLEFDVVRGPASSAGPNPSHDLNIDVRSLIGESQLWARGFDYTVPLPDADRRMALEIVIAQHVIPLMEDLSSSEAVIELIRYESLRVKYGAVISFSGYELIGGIDKVSDHPP